MVQAKREIVAGHWNAARATLAEAERLTPSRRVKRLRRLVALPAWPTILACRCAVRSKPKRQAEAELEAATTRTAVNVAAKRLQLAKRELKRLEGMPAERRADGNLTAT